MMTHRMRIRRHLRSVRSSALTSEERRQELLAAEHAAEQAHDRPAPEAGPARETSPTSRADLP
jgi:hypothetical protein